MLALENQFFDTSEWSMIGPPGRAGAEKIVYPFKALGRPARLSAQQVFKCPRNGHDSLATQGPTGLRYPASSQTSWTGRSADSDSNAERGRR